MIKRIICVGLIALLLSNKICCAIEFPTETPSSETTEEPSNELPTPEEQQNDTTNNISTNMTLGEFKETIQETDLYGNISYSQVFDLMKESINSGESLSLSDAFELSGGLTIPDNMLFDLSESGLSGKLNPSDINAQYGNLICQMNTDYEASDLSSNSQGAMSLFNGTYGDISKQMVITEATLPEGWSMTEMVNSNNSIVNGAYQKAYSDGNFASVRNSINVSGIFSQASKGAIAYTLNSNSSMQTQLDSISTKYKNEAQAKRNTAISQSEATMASNFAKISETKNLVDSFVVNSDGKLETPYDSFISTQINNVSENNMDATIESHPFTSTMFDYSTDGYASHVDGDNSVLSQLTSGYTFQQLLDTYTGNNLAPTGSSLNPIEYIVTGQIGEDIYDLLHKKK